MCLTPTQHQLQACNPGVNTTILLLLPKGKGWPCDRAAESQWAGRPERAPEGGSRQRPSQIVEIGSLETQGWVRTSLASEMSLNQGGSCLTSGSSSSLAASFFASPPACSLLFLPCMRTPSSKKFLKTHPAENGHGMCAEHAADLQCKHS